MYSYRDLLEWIVSLDDIMIQAKSKYSTPNEITNFIHRLYKLAEKEVDPVSYNKVTLHSTINVMLMQRYFNKDNCEVRTKWFPQLVKFII